jgi:hypothetical protein
LGPSYTNDGSSRTGWLLRNGPIVAGLSTWTIVSVVCAPVSITGSNNGRPIYCERAPAGLNILKLQRADGSRNDITLTYRNDAGNLSNPGTSTNDIRTGRQFVAAASMSPGGASGASGRLITSYVNGVANFTADWGTQSTTMTNAIQTTLSYDVNDASATTTWAGDISLVAVFRDGWSSAQHTAFSYAPYDIIRPSRKFYPVVLRSAAPVVSVRRSLIII